MALMRGYLSIVKTMVLMLKYNFLALTTCCNCKCLHFLQNIKLSGKNLDLSESFFVNAKLFAKGELQRLITFTKLIESHKRHFFLVL